MGQVTALVTAILAVFLNANVQRNAESRKARLAALASCRIAQAELEAAIGSLERTIQNIAIEIEKSGTQRKICEPDDILAGNMKLLATEWLLTPHMDSRIEQLAMQSNDLAKAILAFTLRRDSFISFSKTLRELIDGAHATKKPAETSYTAKDFRAAAENISMLAKSAKDALHSFELAHQSDFK